MHLIVFYLVFKNNIFDRLTKLGSMNKSLLICFMAFLLMCPTVIFAQGKPGKRRPSVKSGNTDANQWWIGVRGGVNFSSATVQESYSVFSYTKDYTIGENEKKYNAFTLPGLQFGFSAGFEFIKGLSVNVLPSYSSYKFSYDNSFRWYDTDDPEKLVTTSYNFETRLQYISVPLTFKYELTSGRFKPYIQVGGYYNFLTDAIKKVKNTSIDQASGSDSEINVTELSVGIDDRTKSGDYGVLGGIGFTYNIGNARIGLEVNYRYGLENLDNGGMKYIDNQLVTGSYDVSDDYSLNILELNLMVIIPLKFITSKDYVPL